MTSTSQARNEDYRVYCKIAEELASEKLKCYTITTTHLKKLFHKFIMNYLIKITITKTIKAINKKITIK